MEIHVYALIDRDGRLIGIFQTVQEAAAKMLDMPATIYAPMVINEHVLSVSEHENQNSGVLEPRCEDEPESDEQHVYLHVTGPVGEHRLLHVYATSLTAELAARNFNQWRSGGGQHLGERWHRYDSRIIRAKIHAVPQKV